MVEGKYEMGEGESNSGNIIPKPRVSSITQRVSDSGNPYHFYYTLLSFYYTRSNLKW